MNTTTYGEPVAPSLKLTRKGRRLFQASIGFIVVALAALITTAIWPQPSLAPAAAVDHIGGEHYEQLIVQPGDTLWGISTRLSQGDDRAVILDKIVTYNDLESSDLEIGQTLYIPAVD